MDGYHRKQNRRKLDVDRKSGRYRGNDCVVIDLCGEAL
jgi:hypothetical protein